MELQVGDKVGILSGGGYIPGILTKIEQGGHIFKYVVRPDHGYWDGEAHYREEELKKL